MNIYIGNLPYQVTEDDLRDAFSQFGQVDSANIITDKFSGRSKGFGFVDMPHDDEAREAIESMNDKDLKGRTIKVNEARPREERPARRDLLIGASPRLKKKPGCLTIEQPGFFTSLFFWTPRYFLRNTPRSSSRA